MTSKILIVDDDISLVGNIKQILQEAGYQPLSAYTAEDGLQLAFSEHPDLILLDVMVPNMGGWQTCKELRRYSNVPIIFLTALGNTENVVRGLETGADDYLVKPVIEAELLARIKAHLRRVQAEKAPQQQKLSFADGELIVDFSAHQVIVRGEEIQLTQRENELLTVLVTNAGRVMPTAVLIERAWGLNDDAALDNIKPYIHYLRKKIEVDLASPRWILTVRGVGYRFAEN